MVILANKYGDKYWNQLQHFMEGKGAYHCFHRYHKKLNKNRIVTRWNIVEDYFLALGVCVYRKNTNGNFPLFFAH